MRILFQGDFITDCGRSRELDVDLGKGYPRLVEAARGFEELCEKAPSTYWLADGVHPTAKGHEFIKNEWLKAYKAL